MQGKTYASRLITSFYNGDTCRVAQGLFSIDQEFTGALKATDQGANLALGTWAWDRIFKDGQNGDQFGTQYILGVPGKFSGINEVWDKGYSTIEWDSRTGYDASVTGSNSAVVLANGICQKFAPAAAPVANAKYGEAALAYKVEAGIQVIQYSKLLVFVCVRCSYNIMFCDGLFSALRLMITCARRRAVQQTRPTSR